MGCHISLRLSTRLASHTSRGFGPDSSHSTRTSAQAGTAIYSSPLRADAGRFHVGWSKCHFTGRLDTQTLSSGTPAAGTIRRSTDLPDTQLLGLRQLVEDTAVFYGARVRALLPKLLQSCLQPLQRLDALAYPDDVIVEQAIDGAAVRP